MPDDKDPVEKKEDKKTSDKATEKAPEVVPDQQDAVLVPPVSPTGDNLSPAPSIAPAPPSAPIAATAPAPETPLPAETLNPGPTSPPEENNVVNVSPKLPAQTALDRTAQSMLTQHDLATGKIDPKTYSDLFHSKSTLGKIGTLFGLMVSGAGSGLAHQPNALLDMMNKELERDLEAQKTNQSNKLNWYNAAVGHEKNLADIGQVEANTQSTRIGNVSKAAEADIAKYKALSIPGLTDLSATTNAMNDMLSASVQEQQNRVNRMAPGPLKDAAQSKIDTVLKPAVIQQIAKNQNIFAQKKAVIDALNPEAQKPKQGEVLDPRGPVVNEGLLKSRIDLGKLDPSIPGAIPPYQVPTIKDEINKIQLNRNGYADWIDSFKKLQELKLAGQVPAANVAGSVMTGIGSMIGGALAGPLGAGVGTAVGATAKHGANDLKNAWERERNIQAETLKQRVGRDLSEDDKNKLVDALLPAWNDTEKSRAEAFRKGVQHFKSLEATSNLNGYKGVLSPFPEVPYKSMEPVKKKIG